MTLKRATRSLRGSTLPYGASVKLLFDIGGTKLRYGLYEANAFVQHETRASGGADLRSELEIVIAQAQQNHRIDAVGISFAGQVHSGVITSAPNVALGTLRNLDIPAWIADRFGLKAAIDNDLKCAALAESARRPHAAALAVIYAGTGLGGALVEKGRLIQGCGNLAGEIGHIPFEPAPFACGCGGSDCLELSASGSGVARWCVHLGIDAKTLTDVLRLSASNPKAAEIAQRFERGIAHAVRTVAALFNPDTIILGGGVTAGNPEVIEMAKKGLGCAFAPSRNIAIEASNLGDEANLIGAAILLDRRAAHPLNG